MTGWRLGWIVAPDALMPDLGKLIEYNTSCSPVFVQRAGVVAIREGEPTVDATRERLRRARDRLIDALRSAAGRRQSRRPPARCTRSSASTASTTAWRSAGGSCTRRSSGSHRAARSDPEGEGFVRWCFAASDARLDDGVARLARFLAHA